MLSEVTDWLLARLKDAPNDAAAGGSPYLRMFGLILGGHMLARAAVAAARALEAGDGDAEFLRAKLATAKFYAEQILPQAAALKGAVTAGADTVFEIGAEGHCV